MLCLGMYGNLPRTKVVDDLKKVEPGNIRYGPHLDEAGKLIRDAIMTEHLSLYAVSARYKQKLHGTRDCHLVRIAVVRGLITTHGQLPDRPIAVSRSKLRKIMSRDELAQLSASILVLKSSEFDVWYRRLAARNMWSSQRRNAQMGLSGSRPRGRPRLESDLSNVIVSCVDDGLWRGDKPVAELGKIIQSRHPYLRLPSDDTLCRRVDEIQHERGHPGLIRTKRKVGSKKIA